LFVVLLSVVVLQSEILSSRRQSIDSSWKDDSLHFCFLHINIMALSSYEMSSVVCLGRVATIGGGQEEEKKNRREARVRTSWAFYASASP